MSGDDHNADDEVTQPLKLPGVGRNPEDPTPVDLTEGRQGAHLVIIHGGGRDGESFRVLSTTTVGRSPSSTVFLDDITVSREHAVIYAEEGNVRIEDKDSLNGTFVNGERIKRAELASGDVVQIGKYRFSYIEY